LDSSRLRTGEIVAGIGGVALFVFLFFDWVSGGAVVTGNVVITHPGISGWDYLTDLTGFLIILSGVSGIALAYLAAAGQRVNAPVPRGLVTAQLGVLAVLLILWRMFAGSPTLKIGIFLGLAAAVAIAFGALMALAEDGFRPLLPVAGGRTKAAAAAAPAATPAAAPPAEPPTAEAPAPTAARSSGSRSKSTGTRSKSSGTRKRSSSTTRKRSSTSTRKRSSGGRK
jgi:hypothetical protein